MPVFVYFAARRAMLTEMPTENGSPLNGLFQLRQLQKTRKIFPISLKRIVPIQKL